MARSVIVTIVFCLLAAGVGTFGYLAVDQMKRRSSTLGVEARSVESGASTDRSAIAAKMQNFCGKDMQLLCSDVQPGGGRLMRCLNKVQASVSPECGSFLSEVQATRTGTSQPGPDAAQRMLAACRADLQKVCVEEKPGGGRKARCLLSRKAEISPGCLAFLQSVPDRAGGGGNVGVLKVASACSAETKKLCQGIDVGEGRVIRCLNEHRTDLTDGCKTYLKDLKAALDTGAPSSGQ